MESEDVSMEALVLQDIDLSMVEYHSFTLLPFISMDPIQLQFLEGFYHWFIKVCSTLDVVEEVCLRSFDSGGFGGADLKEGRVKEGDICVVFLAFGVVGAMGEGIGLAHGFTGAVGEGEVEAGEVEGPLCLVAVQVLGCAV